MKSPPDDRIAIRPHVTRLEPSQTLLPGDEMAFTIYEASVGKAYSTIDPYLLTMHGTYEYSNEGLSPHSLMEYPGFLVPGKEPWESYPDIPGGVSFADRCLLTYEQLQAQVRCRDESAPGAGDDGGAHLAGYLVNRRFDERGAAVMSVGVLSTYFQPLAHSLPIFALQGLSEASTTFLRGILAFTCHNGVNLFSTATGKWDRLGYEYGATLIGDAASPVESKSCYQVVSSLTADLNRRVPGLGTLPGTKALMVQNPAAPAFIFNLNNFS